MQWATAIAELWDWEGVRDGARAMAQELAVLGEMGRVGAGVHGEEVVVDECSGFWGMWGRGGGWIACDAVQGAGVHPAADVRGWVLGLKVECCSSGCENWI